MKRTLAIVVLFAFVLMGALPCQAAFMSCGMKMPASAERCGSCAPGTQAGPVLKAAPCCRSLPGQDRGTAPAVLSSLVSGSTAPVKATAPAIAAAAPTPADVVGIPAPLPTTAAGPALSSPRSTVLRL